jgi:ABC-type sugar transport system substrate-binding protein
LFVARPAIGPLDGFNERRGLSPVKRRLGVQGRFLAVDTGRRATNSLAATEANGSGGGREGKTGGVMRKSLRTLLLAAGAVSLVALGAAGAQAAEAKKLTLLASLPNMGFPFFVHMMKQIKAEADTLGNIEILEADGQGSTPKQTADVEAALTKGVDGIIISPNEVDAMAPAISEAIAAGVPVVTIDRRVDKVEGIFAHVGADNVKGGEAQGELILKLFPDGAKVMHLLGQPGASPAIDRAKGVHNILDQHKDKYEIVFEQTANFARDKGLSVTEAGLAALATPPDVIVAANDDMALGAMEAVKGRGLEGKIVIIGFDALPEALGAIRDGGLTASIEQFPGGQSRKAMQVLVGQLRDKTPAEAPVILLTPIAITTDNIDQAERLDELK